MPANINFIVTRTGTYFQCGLCETTISQVVSCFFCQFTLCTVCRQTLDCVECGESHV